MTQHALLQSALVQEGVLEMPIRFSVENQAINAILTKPADQEIKAIVVFSHGWSGFRTGPADILTFLARTFAKHNCASLRFDFRGRGESQGEGLQTSLVTMADDLVAASETAIKETKCDNLILCGLCSGGNVVVGTLKRIPQTKALLLMSVYPFSDGDAFGRDMHRTFHYLNVYWKKILRPDTWSRLFKGDINIKSVFNVIFGHFFKKGQNKKKEGEGTKQAEQDSTQPKLPQAAKAAKVESRLQGKEPPKKHLANLKKEIPGIMVYGTADPDAAAAEKYFGDYITENKLNIDIKHIEGANHNFSSKEWKAQLATYLTEFINSTKGNKR